MEEVFAFLLPMYAQDISLDDLAAELPAHQPRYIAYSYCYTHDDGRRSYPLCFIFISPLGMGVYHQGVGSGPSGGGALRGWGWGPLVWGWGGSMTGNLRSRQDM